MNKQEDVRIKGMKKGYCDVCGEKTIVYAVKLALESGIGEYCQRCQKENKRELADDFQS